MNQQKLQSRLFVILALPRTGSNYLVGVLNSFPEIECLAEVYHCSNVWMVDPRKREYIHWLETEKGIKANMGENLLEDHSLVEINHTNPHLFLEFLALTKKKKYAGFKLFPEHLSWEQLKGNFLSNQQITKIVLKRNLLDVYVSDRILYKTKKSHEYDTSNIYVNIDVVHFENWYKKVQEYYSNIEQYLQKTSQKHLEIYYEEIHNKNSDEEKVGFIYSWLIQTGFDIKNKPKIGEYIKKQDKRNKPFERIQNPQEFKAYLEAQNLQHLMNY